MHGPLNIKFKKHSDELNLYLSVHILSLALFSRCMVLSVSYSFAVTFPSFPFTVVRRTVYSRIHDMTPKYNIKKTTHSILQHFIC